MGADFYEPFAERQSGLHKGGVPVGIGEGSTIRHAIVDKNARIVATCRSLIKIESKNHRKRMKAFTSVAVLS